MPKRLIQQRRGKGSLRFKSPGHRFKGATSLRKMDEIERKSVIKGIVKDIYNDPAKTAPMLLVEYENKEILCYPAPEGIMVGDNIESGLNASNKKGNILPLSKILDGSNIYCIENRHGSGPKFVRSGGNFAKVIAHEEKGVVVQMPSKKNMVLSGNCRAIIGRISGAGRTEKPFVKGGIKKKARNAKGKKHEVVKGTGMNAVNHPHGGGGTRNRKNYSVSRNAPPGAKVGSIAPKRTGIRRGSKK
ncbi:MAG: 50S ribosomal protein L2 [Candidatus Nanoarchaeia archaeon]|nr:50S ribosomal protein L2 [Candidatus Nanoarchaeia archaeon]MDD5499869.1 50S ribosomal protein L2 [Candidatus Nanoarchaeia archaeon]